MVESGLSVGEEKNWAGGSCEDIYTEGTGKKSKVVGSDEWLDHRSSIEIKAKTQIVQSFSFSVLLSSRRFVMAPNQTKTVYCCTVVRYA